jgi:hypothetical protein
MNIQKIFDSVDDLSGWDFSRLRCYTDGEAWDFYDEVAKRCAPSDMVLDIGTGGGEKVLSIASSVLLLIGIDISEQMIRTANENREKSGAVNVRFFHMPAERCGFPDHYFNVISCRQSSFDAGEASRLLVKGGYLLTQQISEDDKYNIKKQFGRGQSFGVKDGTAKDKNIKQLREAGFSKVDAFDYDAAEYYRTPEDLVFLLKHTPIIPGFGQENNDLGLLEDFIKSNTTEKGIATNSKRYMIIAQK